LPMSGNADHAGFHVALGVPLLVLLGLALTTWPSPGAHRAPRIVRIVLLVGIAVFAAGQLLEALGAFGYEDDGLGTANDLVLFHDLGVALGPAGFVLMLAGVIMSIGVGFAARRGRTDSRPLTVAVVVAIAAVAIFEIGALIFGY
jgi:hypothetical protein